jgi:chromosome segregation ATPase
VAASKDENLKAIRNVVAEAVNQQAQLQRESLDTLGTKLDELGSINHQAMERERQLADALARMESLSERAVRLETERSQLLNELALSEVNRLQLEKEKAAYEAHFAGLQRDCAEKEHDRAALKDELDRAMLSVRSLRDGVVQHQLTASTPLTEEAAPVDLRLELEGLQKQIEPLQKLPAQIEALNQVASQFDSLRFLARRFFAVLGNRWTGRRI